MWRHPCCSCRERATRLPNKANLSRSATRSARATLKLFRDADHSFHVPARTGRKDSDVRSEMLDVLAAWIDEVIAGT